MSSEEKDVYQLTPTQKHFRTFSGSIPLLFIALSLIFSNVFMIGDKTVKVSVPDYSVIQVRGISTGDNGLISYALYFNKTSETHFNVAPSGGGNTYTRKTAL